MDTSLSDRLVRTHIPNNVERGWQTTSTSFNIRDNKEKDVLNDFDSTCFNTVERGWRTVFDIAVQLNQTDVQAVCPWLRKCVNIRCRVYAFDHFQ